MTAAEKTITEALLFIGAQQVKTNALLRAQLHQLQHALPVILRDRLDPELGVKAD